MLGLHDRILTAVPRDSITSLPEYESTNKTGASFDTPCGRRLVFSPFLTFFLHGYVIVKLKAQILLVFIISFFQIKPADYMEMVSSMMPDLWVSLADEVPAWVSTKRNKFSVDRTLRWLDDCISLNVVIHWFNIQIRIDEIDT